MAEGIDEGLTLRPQGLELAPDSTVTDEQVDELWRDHNQATCVAMIEAARRDESAMRALFAYGLRLGARLAWAQAFAAASGAALPAPFALPELEVPEPFRRALSKEGC